MVEIFTLVFSESNLCEQRWHKTSDISTVIIEWSLIVCFVETLIRRRYINASSDTTDPETCRSPDAVIDHCVILHLWRSPDQRFRRYVTQQHQQQQQLSTVNLFFDHERLFEVELLRHMTEHSELICHSSLYQLPVVFHSPAFRSALDNKCYVWWLMDALHMLLFIAYSFDYRHWVQDDTWFLVWCRLRLLEGPLALSLKYTSWLVEESLSTGVNWGQF